LQSKQRSKHLQTVLIEAAKMAPRYSPTLALLYDREKQKGNAVHRPQADGYQAKSLRCFEDNAASKRRRVRRPETIACLVARAGCSSIAASA
jgi:hypothetical protein